MESELRHELEQNDLARLLRQGTAGYRSILIRIGIGVAVVLGVWGAFRWQALATTSTETSAWSEFFNEEFDGVLKKNPGTHAARYARLRLAENALQDAKAAILNKREEANTQFEECHRQLDALISDAAGPADLRRLAMYLKGLAFESAAAPDKAKQAYQKLVETFRDSSEARTAESRMKQLEKPSSTEFYRQMLAYKPSDKPRVAPKTDLDDLLKGMGGNLNPNLPIPPPPDLKSDGKIPPPPPMPKKVEPPPGRDLPPTGDAKNPAKAPEAAKKPEEKKSAPPADAKKTADKPQADPKK